MTTRSRNGWPASWSAPPLISGGDSYETCSRIFATTLKTPEYLAINPMGKVPALRHGETVVTECAAICAYLADAFPQAGLAPAVTNRLRGPYYRWLFFAAGPLEAAVTNKACGLEIPPERQGMCGYGTLDRTLAALEMALSGRLYLVGDRFTAADVYVGSHLAWGMQFGTIDRRPAFEDFVGHIRARPAAVRAAQIDDRLLGR